MSAELRVYGEAELRCLPDRAILHLVVEAEAEAQPEAFALAARSAAAVDGVLARFAAAIHRATTAGVIVRPKLRSRKGEMVRSGWVAARATVLEVNEFATLGQLVAELPVAGVSAIHGPVWQVDRANPIHEQARRAATIDAQRRAKAYAETVGLQVGALRWLAEAGLRSDGSGPFPGSAPRLPGPVPRFFPTGAVAPEEPMEIAPEEVTIQARVEACFELVDRS